jgi:hypothetical protein
MSEITEEAISRRRTLALLGFAAVLGLAGSSLVTLSDAEAQTVGMDRRQDRRTGRRDRRENRRDARQVRREGRRTAREIRRQ